MEFLSYLDTILVPLSLFLTIGYHAILWRTFRIKPSVTTIGIDSLKRRSWFSDVNDGDDKKGMLAVQSIRNTLMVTILAASLSILINMALAALINNMHSSGHLLGLGFFRSRSDGITVLKYGSAALFLAAGFLCCSMAVVYLIDACFLVNASADGCALEHSQSVLERGFLLAVCGNRILCITIPVLLWMFGPVAMAVSSGALVWGMFEIDFVK